MSQFLEAKGISKSFGTLRVLDGMDLSVDEGEVISIVGPSGSGKTTLLRIIAGLEKADSGTVSFPRKSHEFGMVFQDFNLWPHKTVLENVIEAPVLVKKVPKETAKKEGLALLHKVSLGDKADKYPFQLSGGEKQRAAIARALAVKPKIILLDEITSNLDPECVGELNSIIRTLASEGLTMLIVSHDIFFVEEIADKVVFMDNGRVIESGPSSKVLLNPAEKRTRQFLARMLNR